MTLDKFIESKNGRFVEYNNDAYKFQCVDLARQYIQDVLGFKPYTAMPGAANAREIFNKFQSNKYFEKIKNTPTGIPQKGDLIFWGYYPFVTTWAGHVAIFTAGNVMRFVSFDQNYPTRQPCKFVNHSYKGVLGWLRPRKV
jgi:hypothetical protein